MKWLRIMANAGAAVIFELQKLDGPAADNKKGAEAPFSNVQMNCVFNSDARGYALPYHAGHAGNKA